MLSISISCIFLMSFLTLFSSAAPANVAATNWTAPAAGDVAASDVTGGTQLTFTNAHYQHVISPASTLKLDGLYLHITNISISDAAMTLFIGNQQADGEASGSKGAQFIVTKGGGSVLNVRGTSTEISSGVPTYYTDAADRQGLWLYAYKNTDGSFTFLMNGNTLTVSKTDIETAYGSDDPSVYVNLGIGWYTGSTSGTMLVREISSGNTNRILSYYDPYGRDSMVLSNGDMKNIEITHFGNQGASEISAKKIDLDKLVIDNIDVDKQVAISFGTSNDGVALSTANAFYIQVNSDGGIWIQKKGIDSGAVSGGNFSKNDVMTLPSKISIGVYKSERNGSYKFTLTGTYDDNTTSVVEFTISSDEMTTIYGSNSGVQVYLGFTSWASHNITIGAITHRDAPVTPTTQSTTATATTSSTKSTSSDAAETTAAQETTDATTSDTAVASAKTGDTNMVPMMGVLLLISGGVVLKTLKKKA